MANFGPLKQNWQKKSANKGSLLLLEFHKEMAHFGYQIAHCRNSPIHLSDFVTRPGEFQIIFCKALLNETNLKHWYDM